ncbi:MAG: LamB/YcsF family protein [Chloroflexi bacterium]|nr:LamB/YcsF family protein [Chloroflexota bacterium]
MVDINCDMGESFGAFRIGEDEAVLPWVTSANVACGFHGGDPRVIEWTVRAARDRGVDVGAHPGFPDLVGFGRRNLDLTPDEARTDILYQIGAVHAFARAAGVPLRHVKPHGQLNNLAVTDRALAGAIVAAVREFDPELILVAYGGELLRTAEEAGLTVGHEVFADREYLADGQLVSRRRPGAVIHDVDRIVRRAISMVKTRQVTAISGETVRLRVDTICVHGDTAGAAEIARALRGGLEAEGIAVRPLREALQPASTM